MSRSPDGCGFGLRQAVAGGRRPPALAALLGLQRLDLVRRQLGDLGHRTAHRSIGEWVTRVMSRPSQMVVPPPRVSTPRTGLHPDPGRIRRCPADRRRGRSHRDRRRSRADRGSPASRSSGERRNRRAWPAGARRAPAASSAASAEAPAVSARQVTRADMVRVFITVSKRSAPGPGCNHSPPWRSGRAASQRTGREPAGSTWSATSAGRGEGAARARAATCSAVAAARCRSRATPDRTG